MKIGPSPEFMKKFMKGAPPSNFKGGNSGGGKKSRLAEALKKSKK